MEYDDVIRVGDKVAWEIASSLNSTIWERHGTVTEFTRNRIRITPDTGAYYGRTVEVPTKSVRKLRIEELI